MMGGVVNIAVGVVFVEVSTLYDRLWLLLLLSYLLSVVGSRDKSVPRKAAARLAVNGVVSRPTGFS